MRHPQGRWLGALLVPDRAAAGLARAVVDPDDPLPVCLVNTSGAGGLLALGRRELAGLRVTAVWSALRDLDDLSGNAARVVAAAGALTGPEPTVRVELPDAPGWERAAEVVEAAGLEAAVRWRADDPGPALARRLQVLVEADLGFTVLDEATTTPDRLARLVGLVAGLIEGSPSDAQATRSGPATFSDDAYAEDEQRRIRRRLRTVVVTDPALLLDRLADRPAPAGGVSGP